MEDWQFFVNPTIVDLNDDGYPEVVNGSGGYLLRAFNYRGEELAGWPKHTGGWIVASATVGDFDGDGNYDVSVSTRNGWLFAWRTEGSVEGLLEWNGYGHDPQNTFNYETPLPGRERQNPDPDPDADTIEPLPDMGADSDATVPDTDDSDENNSTATSGPPIEDNGCGCGVSAGQPRLAWLFVALGFMGCLRRRKTASAD